MKVRIKETGEIGRIKSPDRFENILETYLCFLVELEDGTERWCNPEELKVIPEYEINWEQRRYEIAKEVIASLLIHPESFKEGTEAIVRASINYADALIEKLKENK